ncbi:MAG: carbamoyl phosphate synthase small subunit [Oscillospiraceae bacterium]|nr:carbamoyl phosphate synthase small subunit [Oscillospiraceae bacterium]
MHKYLVLENGAVFQGQGFGAPGEVMAEVVFTTAMTGYFETLTDKSYTGQAVVQTFPLIGNYGIIPEDAEGDRVGPSAYIVREWCRQPSNFRNTGDLDAFLKQRNVVGLCGIDTRALTRLLRERGVMNGLLTDNPSRADLKALQNFRVVRPVSQVSTVQPYILSPDRPPRFRVALFDFGLKENICRMLVKRGCQVQVLPYSAPPEQVLELNPDGIFLSNGPGDPEDNVEVIQTLQALLPHRIPTMGICLGHQLLALAHGFRTEKLKYGHRGANQPVRNTESGQVYISSQNHGYAVVNDSVDTALARPLFLNVNDGTNEGLRYLQEPILTVQFHPEACGGPHDTEFLFDEFIRMMEVNRNAPQS